MSPESQNNPEVAAAQSALFSLKKLAAEKNFQPDEKGDTHFQVGDATVVIYGEGNLGPHGEADPWLAAVSGHVGPSEQYFSLRIMDDSTEGLNHGYEDDGTAIPMTEDEKRAAIQKVVSYEDKVPA